MLCRVYRVCDVYRVCWFVVYGAKCFGFIELIGFFIW